MTLFDAYLWGIVTACVVVGYYGAMRLSYYAGKTSNKYLLALAIFAIGCISLTFYKVWTMLPTIMGAV